MHFIYELKKANRMEAIIIFFFLKKRGGGGSISISSVLSKQCCLNLYDLSDMHAGQLSTFLRMSD